MNVYAQVAGYAFLMIYDWLFTELKVLVSIIGTEASLPTSFLAEFWCGRLQVINHESSSCQSLNSIAVGLTFENLISIPHSRRVQQ